MSAPTGMIYVYTGDGKGKTSAALGQVLRGLGHGWRVGLIAFYKEASWEISEYHFPDLLTPEAQARLQMLRLGKGFFIQQPSTEIVHSDKTLKVVKAQDATIVDDNTEEEHRAAASAALTAAHSLLTEFQPQLLVLDEICNALSDELLAWENVAELLQQRQATHLVLTGRSAAPALIEQADLVSDITLIKHPYQRGQLAVPGLDF